MKMIDEIINIIFLFIISGLCFEFMRRDKSIKKIIGAVLFSIAIIVLGVSLIYLFHGIEAVIETLKMQTTYINGKFIIAGYGCLIGTLLSLFASTNEMKTEKNV